MNTVEKKRHVHKSYGSRERFIRESSVLQYLSLTDISALVPVIRKQEFRDLSDSAYLTVMSRIKGRTLTVRNLTPHIARDLGRVLARIHSLYSYKHFGSFDGGLDVAERYESFSSYACSQLDVWHKRLGDFTKTFDEAIRLIRTKLTGNAVALNSVGSALFCHNDLQPQNILIGDQKVTGIIDWEFAGAYPLVWELRKLTPIIFWQAPSLGRALTDAYTRHLPQAVFPNLEQQAITVAVDCVGALGWSYLGADTEATNRLAGLLETSLNKLR